MRIKYDVISHVGNVRTNNEDMALVFGEQIRDTSASFTFDVPKNLRFAAIVSDGMGGYEKGEIASEMATRSFDKFLSSLPTNLDSNNLIIEIKQWVRNINGEILETANGSGMGCTFCGIIIYEDSVFTINIGDSRIYRLRYDYLKLLTTDHSERNRTGNLDIPSNLIYNALGIPQAFADISPTKIVKGDKYIICSDGLNDMVEDNDIANIMSLKDVCTRNFIDAALSAGGKDNITVILLEIF